VPDKRSAGILLFRRVGRPASDVEVLLGHMGGPYWSTRDAAGWSIPKGEYDAGEMPLDAAQREFEEELGVPVPPVDLVELGSIRQSSGKLVTVWAGESDLDIGRFKPGTFEMEWPRGSGRRQEFPELDRIAWFGLEAARQKLVTGQRVFVDRLAERLGS
jgi:predicted NUDIX family NTP pyrophosphohydrolase